MEPTLEAFDGITHVLVSTVDFDGFTGRDYHPHKEDKGTVCKVLDVEVFDEVEYLDSDDDFEDLSYIVITAERPDGTVIELINHEVKPVGPSWSLELPSFMSV